MYSGSFALKVDTVSKDDAAINLPVLHRILAHSINPDIPVEIVK